jgi:hypothetical protein
MPNCCASLNRTFVLIITQKLLLVKVQKKTLRFYTGRPLPTPAFRSPLRLDKDSKMCYNGTWMQQFSDLQWGKGGAGLLTIPAVSQRFEDTSTKERIIKEV